MSDLVWRLRSMARNEHDDLSVGDEAADEIERLRAEVARLTAERDSPLNRCPQCDHLRLELGEARGENTALLARVEAAEKDAARYRHWRNLSGPVPHCFIRLSGAELDAAIDAAMESGK